MVECTSWATKSTWPAKRVDVTGGRGLGTERKKGCPLPVDSSPNLRSLHPVNRYVGARDYARHVRLQHQHLGLATPYRRRRLGSGLTRDDNDDDASSNASFLACQQLEHGHVL